MWLEHIKMDKYQKTPGLMGFHFGGKGEVRILAEYHRIKHENNSFLRKIVGIAVPS